MDRDRCSSIVDELTVDDPELDGTCLLLRDLVGSRLVDLAFSCLSRHLKLRVRRLSRLWCDDALLSEVVLMSVLDEKDSRRCRRRDLLRYVSRTFCLLFSLVMDLSLRLDFSLRSGLREHRVTLSISIGGV